jgi:prevent-host-death family protein
MTISRVGTRELKSKLSEYMRRVKSGETIIVTERGKTIGQIIPVKPTIEEKLQAVVDSGLAEWNGIKVKPGKPLAINRGPKQISDLVSEDRDVNYLP